MLHRQGQALPQEGQAQASLEKENAAELSAAPGLQHQRVRAVDLMHQSRTRARSNLARHKPPTTPPVGPGAGEARGGPQRGQGAHGQPAGQPKGGAHQLRLSAVRDNRSVERKKERGLQRRGRNYLVESTNYADSRGF